MKHLIYLFLTCVILTSCSNNKSLETNNEANQMDSLKQKFIPIFNGVWVLTDYIEAIEQTKSPLKSASILQGVVAMTIDATTKYDSIDVGASMNNHEGYNFSVYFKNGQTPSSLKTNIPNYEVESNFYDLGYETINNQDFLFLYHYNTKNELIDKQKFTKVGENQKDKDLDLGIQFIVNEKLFSGKHLLIDNKKVVTKVVLNSDGSLTGHSDFKTYYVFTDFLGGHKPVLDGISFNMYKKNEKNFAFIIKNDTTYLYNTIGNEDEGEVLKLGKIQYKLVRQ